MGGDYHGRVLQDEQYESQNNKKITSAISPSKRAQTVHFIEKGGEGKKCGALSACSRATPG
jgi:hypothetical protein